MNLFDNQNNNQQGVNDYFQSQGQNGTNFGNMNNQNNYGNNMNGLDPQKVLISKIFIGWFIGTLLLILITAYSGHPLISVMLFGQFFFIIGMVFAKKNNFDVKKIDAFYLLPIVGGLMIIIPLLKMFTKNSFDIGSVLSFCVFIIGASTIVLPRWKNSRLKKCCTVGVNARIVDVISQRSNSRYHFIVYTEVYEYEYMGQTYAQHMDHARHFDIKEIGQYREIFINPNNPLEIYSPSVAQDIFLTTIGLAFLAPTILALFSK